MQPVSLNKKLNLNKAKPRRRLIIKVPLVYGQRGVSLPKMWAKDIVADINKGLEKKSLSARLLPGHKFHKATGMNEAHYVFKAQIYRTYRNP